MQNFTLEINAGHVQNFDSLNDLAAYLVRFQNEISETGATLKYTVDSRELTEQEHKELADLCQWHSENSND